MSAARLSTADSFEPFSQERDITLTTNTHQVLGPVPRVRRGDLGVGSGGALAALPSGAPVDFPEDAIQGLTVPTAGIQQISPSRRAAAVAPVTRQALAEWQGMVTEVEETHFVAELQGKIGYGVSGNLEEARIPIEEVGPEDLDLLRPGAFFRLCITRELTPTGGRRRYTQVVFRRMPAYRREDLEAARTEARELVRELRVE